MDEIDAFDVERLQRVDDLRSNLLHRLDRKADQHFTVDRRMPQDDLGIDATDRHVQLVNLRSSAIADLDADYARLLSPGKGL